jgi:hypothetical protein
MSPALAQSPTAELHSRAAKPRPKPKPRPSGRLLPFFDAVNNPVTVGFPRNQSVDITPLPPSLSAFDRKVLDTCGAFGSSVSTVSLRRLFTDSPEVVSRIRTAVGGEIFPGRDSDQQFRDDLLTIWSDRAGFAHIFCGEDDGQKIGGLHFVGRYLQLQEQGIAGRLANNGNQEEVQVGEIYTLGVEVRLPNRTIRDRKKGYSYVSSAEELLTEATQAFKRFPATTKQACLNTVRDPDADQPFKAVFVKTNRAIVTYYPDATPSDRDPDCGR